MSQPNQYPDVVQGQPSAPAYPGVAASPTTADTTTGSSDAGGPKGTGKRSMVAVGWVVGIVVVAAVVTAGVVLLTGESLKIGSCVDKSQVHVVDCGSSESNYKIVQMIADQDRFVADVNAVCTDKSTDDAVWYGGRKSKSGTILCLADLRKEPAKE